MSLSLEGLKNKLAIMNDRKNRIFQDLHQVIGAASVLEQLIEQLVNPPVVPEGQEGSEGLGEAA